MSAFFVLLEWITCVSLTGVVADGWTDGGTGGPETVADGWTDGQRGGLRIVADGWRPFQNNTFCWQKKLREIAEITQELFASSAKTLWHSWMPRHERCTTLEFQGVLVASACLSISQTREIRSFFISTSIFESRVDGTNLRTDFVEIFNLAIFVIKSHCP